MRKDVLIMLFGAFVAFLPYLGFPNSWDAILMVIAGVCIIALGIAVRRNPRPFSRPAFSRSEQEPVGAHHEEA